MTTTQKYEMFFATSDSVVIATNKAEYEVKCSDLVKLTCNHSDIVIQNAYVTLTHEQIETCVKNNIFKAFDMRKYLDALNLNYTDNDAATF